MWLSERCSRQLKAFGCIDNAAAARRRQQLQAHMRTKPHIAGGGTELPCATCCIRIKCPCRSVVLQHSHVPLSPAATAAQQALQLAWAGSAAGSGGGVSWAAHVCK